MFGPICTLSREYHNRVSSAPARRRGQLDLAMLASIKPEVERIQTILEILEQRLKGMYSGYVPPQIGRMITLVRVQRKRLASSSHAHKLTPFQTCRHFPSHGSARDPRSCYSEGGRHYQLVYSKDAGRL